jgi:hypothetical protein
MGCNGKKTNKQTNKQTNKVTNLWLPFLSSGKIHQWPSEDAINYYKCSLDYVIDCVWNMIAHAQKPDFVFRRNGRVHLNRRVPQFSRLLTAEVCVSAVVMLDTPCSDVVWRVLATHSIRQFPLHFPSRAAPCAITFQLDCTKYWIKVIVFLIECSICKCLWFRERVGLVLGTFRPKNGQIYHFQLKTRIHNKCKRNWPNICFCNRMSG